MFAEERFTQHLQAARQGDQGALVGLLEAYRCFLDQVADACVDRGLQGKFGVSDLIQETVVGAYVGFAGFAGSTPEEFRSWLRRILVNVMRDQQRHYRKAAKRACQREVSLHQAAEQELIAPNLGPASAVVQAERRQRLLQALERLPDPYRQILRRRHLDHRTDREIAAELGLAVKTVQNLWTQAVRLWRNEVNPGNESI